MVSFSKVSHDLSAVFPFKVFAMNPFTLLQFLKSIFPKVYVTSDDSQYSLSSYCFSSFFFNLKFHCFKPNRRIGIDCCYVVLNQFQLLEALWMSDVPNALSSPTWLGSSRPCLWLLSVICNIAPNHKAKYIESILTLLIYIVSSMASESRFFPLKDILVKLKVLWGLLKCGLRGWTLGPSGTISMTTHIASIFVKFAWVYLQQHLNIQA